ncbi:hypothetical protein C8E87_6373 [Paractinoplanes brasiliensis]|uniref:Uncharacterized protein n=1 Tax=Paractinoplanes brasiliensis TaxID=52695 RepID=A0A4R6K0K6_9ACTN|nr:hypothetical protein C8E87_6373 [Actinoplanes brasiliensis]GID31298.1 hypothetical protein Abr02nite_62810 [Actinoplanes brasiliensis]
MRGPYGALVTSAPVLENAPPTRPAVVTVAYRLQVALVAALLIVVVVSILDAVHYNGLINEAVRTTSEPDMTAVSWEREDNIAGLLFVGVPLFVLAVWLGISAVLVRRGSNVGRVLTWVGVGAPSLCVLMSCFLGVLGVFAFAMIALPFGDPAVYEDDPDLTGDFTGDAFTETVYSADSGGWSLAYDIITTTCLMLALLLAVAVVVLLATPPSARYFRRGEPVPPAPVPRQFPSPYATTPAPNAATPFPYATAPAPYAATPYPYATAPASYAATPFPYAAAPASYAATPFPYAATPAPYAATPYPYAAAPAPYYPAAASPFPPAPVPMYLPPDPASTDPHPAPGSASEPPSSGPMYPPSTVGPTYPHPHAAPSAPWGMPSPSPHPAAAPMRAPSVDPTLPAAESTVPTASAAESTVPTASAAEPTVPTAPATEPTAPTPDAGPGAPADGSPPASSGPDASA